ncbi:hypothetical protein DCAR_0727915 [Daucus carota subsp. sativus]|uniref:Uncharacterized protein n=1 Tax=Daucus carota subsp. sativus TaxID=79200 RepID=A0A164T3T0_DAUCS|nr:hypothetical protein DCAR_0727915 [Daucus carota subsp. sativus]
MREKGSDNFSNFKNQTVDFSDKITADNISQYGFLLETEMLQAIQKGNSRLLKIARTRIRYLYERTSKKLFTEAVNGKEEAIISLTTDLLNSGEWERASRLRNEELAFGKQRAIAEKQHKNTIDFIWAHKDLVHPNTLKCDLDHDNDAVRMALNQIHYGSLRRRATQHDNVQQPSSPRNQKVQSINFIFSHKDLVDEQTMQGVAYNSDKAISDALQQIHRHPRIKPGHGNSTRTPYKDTLLKSPSGPRPVFNSFIPEPLSPQPSKKLDLYFTGFSDEASCEEIWKGLKKWCRIRDIVIPSKRDRRNRKYGFIKFFSPEDAYGLLHSKSPVYIKDRKIVFDWQKGPQGSSSNEKARPSNFTKDPQSPLDTPVVEFPTEGLPEWMERVARSVRIELANDYAPDSLWEILVANGIYHVEVLKLGPSVFMLSCKDVGSKKELDLSALELSVLSQRDVAIKDLILPRVTGIRLHGLPVCA